MIRKSAILSSFLFWNPALGISPCFRFPAFDMMSASVLLSARDLIKKWAQVSQVADKPQQAQVDRLAEALKHFSRAEAQRLVQGAQGVPILSSYSNDGTPQSVRKRVVTSGAGGSFAREGGAGGELLCQRTFFRTRCSTGGWKTAALIRDPVPLVHGKGADSIFSAAVEFHKTLRQMGHWGIALQHYAFDRAMHAPLTRRFKQHHALLSSAWEAPKTPQAGPHSLFPPAVLEWIVETPCCNHDVHNGLKWSLFSYLTDEGFMKDLFIAIESLRNGYDLLQEALGGWLPTVVTWSDSDDLWEPSFALALWSSLGVEPAWAEEFVDLGMQWESGQLLVHERHRGSMETWSRLMSCIQYSHKFDRFSDSRWCTLGRSAKQMTLAHLTGLGSLVQGILDDKSTSDYHLGGYRRWDSKMANFCGLAAYASGPADSLLKEMLKDDRLAIHKQSYQDLLQQEFSFLQELPSQVWAVVASVSGESGPALRCKTLACAHISLAFIHERVWAPLDGYPWKLVDGDILANLKELGKDKERPPTTESLTCKVWILVTGDFPPEIVRDGLELLRHLPWSSAIVEQQHASASQVSIRHRGYGMNALTARALIHTSRLYYAVRPVDKQIARLEDKLRSHMARQPAKIRAGGIFFREAMSVLKHRPAASAGLSRSTQSGTRIRLKQAHQKFKQLPSRMVTKCEEAARLEMYKKEQDQAAKLLTMSKELETVRFKKRCEFLSGLPPKLSFSECTFSQQQTDALTSLFHNSDLFSYAKVAALRKSALSPGMLSDAQLALHDAQAVKAAPVAKNPWWLPILAWCREAFVDTAIKIGRDSDVYYKFMFAKQQPQLAAFCPLQVEEHYTPVLPVASGPDGTASPLIGWLHRFSCDRMQIKMATEIDSSDDSDVMVLVGLVDEGNQIVADGPIYTLADFVANLPALQKASKQRATTSGGAELKKERAADWAEQVALYPWLAEKSTAKYKRARTSGPVFRRMVVLLVRTTMRRLATMTRPRV